MPRHPSINNKNRRRTMETKNIFKTLAAAMLMPAMLLTASCSSEDELVINGTPRLPPSRATPCP